MWPDLAYIIAIKNPTDWNFHFRTVTISTITNIIKIFHFHIHRTKLNMFFVPRTGHYALKVSKNVIISFCRNVSTGTFFQWAWVVFAPAGHLPRPKTSRGADEQLNQCTLAWTVTITIKDALHTASAEWCYNCEPDSGVIPSQSSCIVSHDITRQASSVQMVQTSVPRFQCHYATLVRT